jgi:anti-sigma regulatory factor (Ser/Thr protein kinase)
LDDHAGQAVSSVGEPIWPGRSEAEIAEATRHEALLNSAFAGAPVQALCPYHVGTLADAVVADVYRAHPVVQMDGHRQASPGFADPAQMWRSLSHLPTAPPRVRTLEFDRSGLPAVRKAVRAEAEAAGLDAERGDNLAVATSEVASNSIRHGGGSGVLRTWLGPDGVVCEVHDRGEITDPLAGMRRPDLAAEGGWGLWLANQLCDLIQLHTGPGGTMVRLRMTR